MKLWIAPAIVALGLSPAFGQHTHGSRPADAATAKETTFGRAADPAKAGRTVQVEMTDQMRFQPAEITVKRGEIVRFVPVNKGQVMHEMVLGTMQELKKHAEQMKKHAHMQHDESNMAHVAPGKQGVIGWQFTKAGEFFYACLIPGHFDAGMIGKIKVVADSADLGPAQEHSPYAGQHTRPIKALSDDEVRQFLAGAGMGYAKAAELNGYPGPMHVLELADKLELSTQQREQTRRLMESHKAEARALGSKRVDAERRLDALFRPGRILESQDLAEAVKAAAALEAEYRLSHLETHRRMRALLTEEQVSHYAALRGYLPPVSPTIYK